jgi:hypothetical protein
MRREYWSNEDSFLVSHFHLHRKEHRVVIVGVDADDGGVFVLLELQTDVE